MAGDEDEQQRKAGAAGSSGRFSAPQLTLAGERASNSALFLAFEALRRQLSADWSRSEDFQPGIDEKLARFFDEELAPAVQRRESQLVNELFDCCESEIRARTSAIHDQLRTKELEVSQTRAQLDRRVADSNAMRKEFYKHLLMLRDMVNKQKNDPRTLSALNDAIANASSSHTREDAGSAGPSRLAQRLYVDAGGQRPEGPTSPTARREKEKWEQRLHEASAESQQLRDQISMLRNQVETLSQNESSLWFVDANSGIAERQRIIDAVYKGKCTWEDVGASIIELLNNDVMWEGVEHSVRIKTVRASRGLEALITKVDSLQASSNTQSNPDDEDTRGALIIERQVRRLSSDGGDRLIPCRACQGAGYIRSGGGTDDDDSDSYLRRTLAQVLELKTALEKTSIHSKQVEHELHTTLSCYSQLQSRMEQIEVDKLHRGEIGIQADLDEEESLDGDDDINWDGADTRRKTKRVQQYERLIGELKRSLADKDTGIRDLRAAVESSQSRLVLLQRQSQQEQGDLKKEISSLKTSLTLAMKHRNSNIDEKQAAVKFLIKRLTNEQRQMTLHRQSTAALIQEESDSDTDEGGDDPPKDEDELEDSSDEEHELERSEKVARRYSEAIDRVQKEFEDHQARMGEIEEEIKQQEDTRKRTNSIMLGTIAVSMSSHPRDLFKALSSAQTEMSKLRRASQKSSTLQADRLLTLTTHLSHISEELCMVRKRTNAEIEYWRLECEKLQNIYSGLLVEQHSYQQRLAEMQDRLATPPPYPAGQTCSMCEKHQARLSEISDWMLAGSSDQPGPTNQSDSGDPVEEPSASESTNHQPVNILTDNEHRALSSLVLEIEEVCSTMSTSTQGEALALLGRAIFGKVEGSESHTRSPRVNQNMGLLLSGNLSNPESTSRSRSRSNSRTAISVSPTDSLGSISPVRIRAPSTQRNVLDIGKQPAANIQVERESECFPVSDVTNLDGVMAAFPEVRPGIGGLLAVRGRAVSTISNNDLPLPVSQSMQSRARGPVFIGDRGDLLPSYKRKKTVKRLLSHQEFELWRGSRKVYNSQSTEQIVDTILVSSVASNTETTAQDSCLVNPVSDGTPYSIQTTNNGEPVYVVDVEVSEDEDDNESNFGSSTRTPIASISLPRVVSIGDQLISSPFHYENSPYQSNPGKRHQAMIESTSILTGLSNQFPLEDESVLVKPNTDDDPPVIRQLRDLLRVNDAAREQLSLANWKLLVSLALLFASQSRLSTFGIEARMLEGRTETAGGTRTRTRVRAVMEGIVRQRELSMQTARTAHSDAKRECWRLQSHIMHTIASMMASLNQRRKPVGVARVDSPRAQGYLPFNLNGSRGNFRPVYPASQVNLGYLPPTQQLSTPNFPIASDISTSASLKPMLSPPVGFDNAGNSGDGVHEDSERSLLVHLPLQEGCLHGAFPHRELKFTGPVSPFDYSLTHSASSLAKNLPIASEAIRRSSGRLFAGCANAPSVNKNHSQASVAWTPERPDSARTPHSQSPHRNPIRPQSSPSPCHRTNSPRTRQTDDR